MAREEVHLRDAEGLSLGPLVSVVVVFLDEAPFLGEAIASLLAQTYAAWELLLVDDGSTDGSTGIARAAAARHPGRVRHLEHPGHTNRGISASRNLGLREARGELLAFLDGDDLWLPRKLERQVEALLARPEAGALYGTSLFWFHDYNNEGDRAADYVLDLGAEPGRLHDPPELLRLVLEREEAHPTNCAMLVRREVCAAAGGWDERFRAMYDDSVFLARLFLATPVLVIDDCSSVYRMHTGSTCHQARDAGEYRTGAPSPSRLAYLEWLEGHLRDAGVRDAGVWRALEGQLAAHREPGRAPETAAAPRAAPDLAAVSRALRELARLRRAWGLGEEADALELRALRVLGRRRSKVHTLLRGVVAWRGGIVRFAPDAPTPLLPGVGEAEVRLVGVEPGEAGFGEGEERGHLLVARSPDRRAAAGFAFLGEPAPGRADGGAVELGTAEAGRSLNAGLLRAGLAHPAFDPAIHPGVRTALAAAAREAREAGKATVWPRLARHLERFRAEGRDDPVRFAEWLRASGADEPLLLASSGEAVRLSAVVEASGGVVRLTVPPEELIGFPEPIG